MLCLNFIKLMTFYRLCRYSMLCQSLGIEGWSRLKVVELRALKRPLAQALAFACVLSIGDFGVVALFGNDDFRTLPSGRFYEPDTVLDHRERVRLFVQIQFPHGSDWSEVLRLTDIVTEKVSSGRAAGGYHHRHTGYTWSVSVN